MRANTFHRRFLTAILAVLGVAVIAVSAASASDRHLANTPAGIVYADCVDRALANGTASSDCAEPFLGSIPEVAPGGPSATATSPPFSWTDAGVGAGIAIGALLLTAAAAVAIRKQRRPAHF